MVPFSISIVLLEDFIPRYNIIQVSTKYVKFFKKFHNRRSVKIDFCAINNYHRTYG